MVKIGKDKDIAIEVTEEIEKRKMKVDIAGGTRSSSSKFGSPTEMRRKHIITKIKQISKGSSPKRKKLLLKM